MKKKSLLIILIIIVSCNQISNTKDLVLENEILMSKSTSIDYDLLLINKPFSQEEKNIQKENVRFIRIDNDSLVGGSFWIKNDSLEHYYDAKNLYEINHKNNTIIKFSPYKNQEWSIYGSSITGAVKSGKYFLKKNILKKIYSKDSVKNSKPKDTVIDNLQLKMLLYNAKDNPPYTNLQYKHFLSNKNLLKRVEFSAKFKDQTQYDEWNFSNEKFDNVTVEDFKKSLKLLTDIYEVKEYKPRESIKLLENGTKAPDFSGQNFISKDSIHLKQFKGKVVILDFWYMTCMPCIKAIPFLNKIHSKYSKDNLTVLGLNPFDNNEINRNKIPEFIKTHKMEYSPISISQTVRQKYNVTGFPSFYIIDKTGEVVYSKVGHSNENEKEIELILDKILK